MQIPAFHTDRNSGGEAQESTFFNQAAQIHHLEELGVKQEEQSRCVS